MISEEQKKKYEEDANKHLDFVHYNGDEWVKIKKAFIAGAEHAHSEGKKEGWNEALDELIISTSPILFVTHEHFKKFTEQLQKLRK